jgi:hypothetical protein
MRLGDTEEQGFDRGAGVCAWWRGRRCWPGGVPGGEGLHGPTWLAGRSTRARGSSVVGQLDPIRPSPRLALSIVLRRDERHWGFANTRRTAKRAVGVLDKQRGLGAENTHNVMTDRQDRPPRAPSSLCRVRGSFCPLSHTARAAVSCAPPAGMSACCRYLAALKALDRVSLSWRCEKEDGPERLGGRGTRGWPWKANDGCYLLQSQVDTGIETDSGCHHLNRWVVSPPGLRR